MLKSMALGKWKSGKITVLVVFLLFFGITTAQVLPVDALDAIRARVDRSRFNYIGWTASAFFNKAVSASLKAEKFMEDSMQSKAVETYFEQVGKVEESERNLEAVYNTPGIKVRPAEITQAKTQLKNGNLRLKELAPVVEAILQNQTERTLSAMGFGVVGQIIPPVLYQVSDLPLNLIVSPREEISTALSISLKPGMDALEKDSLEKSILAQQSYAALVEEVGGVGAYPTMVMRSNNIHWLTETVAHEWIHNYLSLHPLGIRYFKNYSLRTINETTANLAGKEIGRALIAAFYQHRIVVGYYPLRAWTWVPNFSDLDLLWFDFVAEMRETRVQVDEFLAEGKVEEAERYMEARRKVFWDAGYAIRKINQAYFAFHGSYNDSPGGGASGEDPIGPAVRSLRYRYHHLKPFIDRIKSVRSFDDLMKILP